MRSINIPSILNEKNTKEAVASCKQNTSLLSSHHFCIHQERGYTNDAHETILMAHSMAHGVAISISSPTDNSYSIKSTTPLNILLLF